MVYHFRPYDSRLDKKSHENFSMSLIAAQENDQITKAQLSLLDQVLREECHYVDREALGHWCGLTVPWWEPESQLSREDYFRLLRQLHDNEVPDIALRVASRTRLADAGLMGYAMLASPTLEQSLHLACHLVEQTFHFLRLSLTTTAEHALIHCEVLPAGSNYFQLLLEEWLITLWRYIQVLLPEGVAACASYATLNYGAPSYHWQYQQQLGCRVEFDQTTACLAIPKQWLYIAVNSVNAQTKLLYETQVRRMLQELEHSGDVISRVKRLLVEKPGDCRYQLELTAPLLSLSPRTLRRYLADAGTSFRRVCLEVRMELAKDYLINTQLTAQEIAYQLGYAQPNNFHRAFKSFFGESPEKLRVAK